MTTHTRLLRGMALLTACALVLAISIPDVGAVTITTADGVGADAYTLSPGAGGANANWQESGTSTGLNVRDTVTGSGGYHADAYFKFDLSGLTGAVASADLKAMIFFNHVAPTQYDVYGLNDSENADGWGEFTLTYNNSGPQGNDITSEGLDGTKVTFLGNYDTTGDLEGDTMMLLSGASLVNFLNDDSDGLVTLILNHAGPVFQTVQLMGKSNTDTINSLNGGPYAPRLEITLVPEPGTLALLSGALVIGLARRRRR